MRLNGLPEIQFFALAFGRSVDDGSLAAVFRSNGRITQVWNLAADRTHRRFLLLGLVMVDRRRHDEILYLACQRHYRTLRREGVTLRSK